MRKIVFLILILLFVIVNLYSEYWNQFEYSKLSESEKLELRERHNQNKRRVEEFNKSKGTNWNISWHDNKKFMKWATIRIDDEIIYDSQSVITFAEETLSDFLPLIKIKRDDLIVSKVRVESRRDYFSVKYKQHVNGILFEEAGFASISYRKGKLKVTNYCFPDLRMNTVPSITKDEAWKIVKKNDIDFKRFFQTNGEKFGTCNEEDWMKRIELVFFSAFERNDLNGKLIYEDHKLAYKVLLPRSTYFIDAINSDIIMNYITEIDD